MLSTLVVATHNRKKATEMNTILSARFPDLTLLTLADFDGAPEPDETGTTYAENALIKARSAAAFTQAPSAADDAGLEIDALDGAPGLYSKRFGGEDLPFPEKMALILDRLSGAETRRARFRCCVALVVDGREWVVEATCEGSIAHAPSGSGGFGYDPIFLPDDAPGRTMADLTAAEKHAISHRGKVLAMLGDLLVDLRAGTV
jgi:XTP/dITP diphosphohydrolase